MSEIVAIVPTEGIEDTHMISHRFLIEAKVPMEFLSRAFGILHRAPKDDNYLNPFKWARGEPGAVGDDGIPRWNMHLIDNGKIMFSGSADSSQGEPGLQELLNEAPECAILVPPQDLDPLQLACTAIERNLLVHQYAGRLSTS